MSAKTDRLSASLPSAYATDEHSSVLHRLLDVVGAELTGADEAVKHLLTSHGVDHASGPALDGLAAVYGLARRRLHTDPPRPEGDELFRARLKAVVPTFTGGGTRRAIQGAVQSALGLPFDFATTSLPPQLSADLQRLVAVEDFTPTAERLVHQGTDEVDDATEVIVDVGLRAATEVVPRIVWTFTNGTAQQLSVERRGYPSVGVRSTTDLLVQARQGTSTLVLATLPDGGFSAELDDVDVSGAFTDLDGHRPAALPTMPYEPSRWVFRAGGAAFDVSTFDVATFDLPVFTVELAWSRRQLLTFDVTVPYFLAAVVRALADRHHYPGDVFAYDGLPFEMIQQVVDGTRAAGVRGSVHFSLLFNDDHGQLDRGPNVDAVHRATEVLDARDDLTVGSVNAIRETMDVQEAFAFAAEFDTAFFDGPFGFV